MHLVSNPEIFVLGRVEFLKQLLAMILVENVDAFLCLPLLDEDVGDGRIVPPVVLDASFGII